MSTPISYEAPDFNIKESVLRIIHTVHWWPGRRFDFPRRSGKTTAILKMIREKHNGEAVYFHHLMSQQRHAQQMWADMYPDLPRLRTAGTVEMIGGIAMPVFVDDCWSLPPQIAYDLGQSHVVCRMGTYTP